jgi:transposase-like protein
MFKNLHELIATMPDEATCRKYYEEQRWNGKPVCPYCGYERSYKLKNGKQYKCASKTCYKVYTVTVGTIFEDSNIPLNKWFMALYLCSSHKKGISSIQLAKDIGVTQKTGWFMLHRLREGMKERGAKVFKGIVESDETYMARKYRSDYKGLSPEEVDYIQKNKQSKKSKGAVIGLAERETGKIKVVSFDENNLKNITNTVREYVDKRATLHTDESNLYNALGYEMKRESVVHSKKEWVKTNYYGEKIHTNTVENFWSVMKRGVYGIYHQLSYKHLQRYCDEFSYRYNNRKMNDADRFTITLRNTTGRLTYKDLVRK